MDRQQPTVALFAKYPRAGQAKTRLIPALGPEGAAALHRRLVEQTLEIIRQSGFPFIVWTTGASHDEFAEWLGEDVPLAEQGEGDLGDRLSRVPAPAILLGADIPDLSATHLKQAAETLEDAPVAIGPAADGGYYLLTFRNAVPFLFDDMPWGGDGVLGETIRRLEARDMAFTLLETLRDCDRPEDLAHWPDLAP